MEPVTNNNLVTASCIADKHGYIDRDKLKEGDVLIHEEAERERLAEHLSGGPQDVSDFILHPQHQLKFEADNEQPFSCYACTLDGTGNRYTCKSCNVELHPPCAVSSVILEGLISENTKVTKFIHEHPLNLVTGATDYICSYCNNKCNEKYRYYCEPCNMYFDTMCVNHPTRLLSFFHPQHELELSTRRHLRLCDVCLDGGDSHARVYSCVACDFFVHPCCAVKNQYAQHSLHPDHYLLLVNVPSHPKVKCMSCHKKCKGWCYSCVVCKGVSFHQDCINIGSSTTGKSSGKEFAEEVGKGIVEVLVEKVVEVTLAGLGV
ncbi:uncharacterized protein LOC141602531 [Silene latifolia]|uniref:uncharacterized protein LOC141602531 n=1 Tax=Silene latifolia TaxID=37657 RepID=UPI003D786BB9